MAYIGALIAAGATAAGAIGGSLINSAAQAKANETNVALSQEQMEFQKQMSNTAYRRGVWDMKQAGLNPILSALGSGASTPSGASGSGSQANFTQTRVENTMEAFTAAAKEVMAVQQMKENIELTKAQTAKTKTEEHVQRKGIPESDIKNDIFDSIRPYIKNLKQMATSNAQRESKQYKAIWGNKDSKIKQERKP